MHTQARKDVNEKSRANGTAQSEAMAGQRASITPAQRGAAQLTSMSDLANKSRSAAHVARMRRTLSSRNTLTTQRRTNSTGLPDDLKSGLESLSGFNLNDVQVNYNSPEPAKIGAHAVTQGRAIHVAPGQQEHVNHEGWHVVQQLQNRVRPTTQIGNVQVNDDSSLGGGSNGRKSKTGGRFRTGRACSGSHGGKEFARRRRLTATTVQRIALNE